MQDGLTLSALRRPLMSLALEIRERRRTLQQLRDEAATFASYDFSPLVWDGSTVTRLRPLHIPPALIELIQREAGEVLALEREFAIRRLAGEDL